MTQPAQTAIKPIRIFVARDEEGEHAFLLRDFAPVGLESEEAVTAEYGDAGEWHTVNLRPLTAGMDRDIKRAARVQVEDQGFAIDPTLLPAARAAQMVADWTFEVNGQAVPVTMEGFDSLPVQVASVLDAALCARAGSPDARFFALLRRKQAPSASPKPSAPAS